MNRKLVLRIALLAIIAILLGGLLYFAPRPAAATAKSFSLVLKDYVLTSGPALMKVNQDDTVTLRVQSDQDGDLEIHGYERELSIGKAAEATLTFVADKSGRFEIHVHGADHHHDLAVLEVQPR
jgi:hypothetical protein